MSERVYDLIIIGGGISGIGIAREAAAKGLKTLLLEKGRLLQAASSNNLRIIHGGFRYIQNLSMKRVVESIIAQDALLRKYPQYISKLPCLLPLNRHGFKSALPVAAANIIYSSLFRIYTGSTAGNKILSRQIVDHEAGILKGHCMYGALLWNDAVITDIKSLHKQLEDEVRACNVEIKEDAPVEKVNKAGNYIEVKCQENSVIQVYTSKYVINCTGAWIDDVKINLGNYERKRHKWCKAYNIILSRKIEQRYAIAIESRTKAEGKRLYFMVPREEGSAIGTEYREIDSPLDKLSVSQEEKQQFLERINKALPCLNIQLSDIASYEVGVLPYLNRGNSGFKLVGSERVYKYGNYIDVLSTKYTTFETQASRIIKMLQIVKK